MFAGANASNFMYTLYDALRKKIKRFLELQLICRSITRGFFSRRVTFN